MYEIPKAQTFSKLINDSIGEIDFRISDIYLLFDKYNCKIQLFGPFNLKNADQLLDCNEVYPINNDYGLVQLIGKKVISIEVNNDRDVISITFEEGIILNLISNPKFESFIIYLDDDEIII